MTTPRDVDRDFRAYFDGRTVGQAPDGLLDAAMADVESTWQRPRLLVADRWWWPRMVGPAGLGPRVAAVVTVLLLLIALAALLVVVGASRRPAPPFGLAKPGLIAFDVSGDLFASKPDGSGLVQLTSGPEFDLLATYSPDGTLVAFESQQPDFSYDVFVMKDDGSAHIRVIDGLAEIGPIAWSPDSRHLAVAARPVGDDGQIIFGAIDDPGAARLGGPDAFGTDPSWSPDGRRLAFDRTEPCCSLWVMDVDGSNGREIAPNIGWTRSRTPTSANRVVGGRGAQPAWSVDGRRLAFLATGVGNYADVYVVDADGNNLRNVSNSAAEETGVAWSPDGTRLAFVRQRDAGSSNAVFLVADADGSNERTISGPPLSADVLVWSPDGARLLGMVTSGWNTGQTIIELDPSGHIPPVTTRISDFGTVSYQRLAP